MAVAVIQVNIHVGSVILTSDQELKSGKGIVCIFKGIKPERMTSWG